jgi:toxin ParE1/3/4
MQVRWSRKALLNLDNAVEYIAVDNPVKAAEVAQRIWDSAQQLVDQPGMGRPGRVAGTRELLIPGLPFILPYVEKGMAVIILRVMHAAMKWPQKL